MTNDPRAAQLAAGSAGRRALSQRETVQANRRWWDAQAADYLSEHGRFLGDRSLVWGPEGWSEDELGLLGSITGLRALEFGCGAGQGARWAHDQGAEVVGIDLSAAMIAQGRGASDVGARDDGVDDDAGDGRALRSPALLCSDALELPFTDASFDVAFSAYGAVCFVADSAALMRELARVLRPGGRLVFSTTHPIRWAFPDVPGEAGLTVSASYFDTSAYVETDENEQPQYAEHHRTLGQRVAELVDAGLQVSAIDELTWHPENAQSWGGWSPLRGRLIPGTVVFSATKPST